METTSEIKAFNKLFADYHGLFVRFANTYTQDEAAAEDIAVEGIMYYWELPSPSSCPRGCGTTHPGTPAAGERPADRHP